MIGPTRVASNWKKPKPRNPFPDDYFFHVPLCLLDRGLVRVMSGSEFKRYLTLLRLSNYKYGTRVLQRSLKELEKLDGVSERRAWQVNGKLQDRGLVQIEKTKPTTYILVLPACWPDVDETGAYLPPSQVKSAKGAPEPLHWGDIAKDD